MKRAFQRKVNFGRQRVVQRARLLKGVKEVHQRPPYYIFR